jgi:hypothetical protein
MCNEIEETLIEQFIVTMCGEEDPVPITAYPVGNENDLTYGSYSRAELTKEGIEIIPYETFVMETWRVGRLMDVRIRPHIYRKLSAEMVKQIHDEILAVFPNEVGDDY